ncbi:hypothetical protein RYX36_003993 [Vicia faba]
MFSRIGFVFVLHKSSATSNFPQLNGGYKIEITLPLFSQNHSSTFTISIVISGYVLEIMVSKTFERSLNHDFYSGETEDAPMDYYSDYDDDADDYFDEGDASDHADSRRPEMRW